VERLTIDGAWLHEPVVRRDQRGSFFEVFRGQEFAGGPRLPARSLVR
jgi:dTDP-4-dehydrorhamnose 3,5-epimerase-like enzyme